MAEAVARKKKKEELTSEDAFLGFVERATDWTRAHSRAVMVAVIILALIVAGGFYYRSYRANLRARASVELSQLRTGVVGGDVIEALTAFVARFDGTPSADEGRVLLARFNLAQGNPEGALAALRPISSQSAASPVGYAIVLLTAEAHKQTGDTEGAIAALDRLADEARLDFQRRAALADKARLLAETGSLEAAAAIYLSLAEEDETGANLYRARYGEIQAMIDAGVDPLAAGLVTPRTPVGQAPLELIPIDTLATDSAPESPVTEGDSAQAPAE